MKTAVSIPEDLFRLAETAARRLRISRSQLYATALAEFLNRQETDAVTERLNEVYSRRHAKVDSVLNDAQLTSLDRSNVMLRASLTGLRHDSVVNVSQLLTLDHGFLTQLAGALPPRLQHAVDSGLRTVLQLSQ